MQTAEQRQPLIQWLARVGQWVAQARWYPALPHDGSDDLLPWRCCG